MTKIIRVHYNHQNGDPRVLNTYVDFTLNPNAEDVKYVELMEVIPENKKSLAIFKVIK